MTPELAEKMEAALRAARRDHNPSAEDRTRVHAALQRALAAPSIESPEVTPLEPGSAHVGAATSAKFATLFKLPLLGAVMVLAGAGVWSVTARPSSQPQRQSAAAIEVARGAQAEDAPQPGAARALANQLAAAPESHAVIAHDAERSRLVELAPKPEAVVQSPRRFHSRVPALPRQRALPGSRVERAAAPTAAESPTVANPPAAQSVTTIAPARVSTWSAESELMRGALRALNLGKPSTALQLLAEHAARYPEGMLRAERLGLRVVALCASGQRADGERERLAFLREFAALPIAVRVRAACPGAKP